VHRPFGRALVAIAILAGIQVPTAAAFATSSPSSGGAVLGPETLNTAVSVDDQNGTSVFHLSFQIARRSGTVVDLSNVAVAVSQCSDCRSVAIAVQIDLVSPVPAELNASNTAVAANVDCEVCDTLAAAFQYVIATPDPVRLTRTGRREIHQIERALNRLGRSDDDPATTSVRIQALAAELSQVLSTQLVPAGGGSHDDHGDRGNR
jgi:hypothetical protein